MCLHSKRKEMKRKQVFNSRSRSSSIGQLENSSKSCVHLALVEGIAVGVVQTWVEVEVNRWVVEEVHRWVVVVAHRLVVEVAYRWVVVVVRRRVAGEPFVGELERVQDMVEGMVGEQDMVEDMVGERDLERHK